MDRLQQQGVCGSCEGAPEYKTTDWLTPKNEDQRRPQGGKNEKKSEGKTSPQIKTSTRANATDTIINGKQENYRGYTNKMCRWACVKVVSLFDHMV